MNKLHTAILVSWIVAWITYTIYLYYLYREDVENKYAKTIVTICVSIAIITLMVQAFRMKGNKDGEFLIYSGAFCLFAISYGTAAIFSKVYNKPLQVWGDLKKR